MNAGAAGQPLEIERKYLIVYPDLALLRGQPGCHEVRIEQIYLTGGEPGVSERIRRWEQDGSVTFFHTKKTPVSALTRIEVEHEVSAADYAALRNRADPLRQPIEKIRFRIPFMGQCVEVDVFPFWQHQAVAEVELPGEDTPVLLPPYLSVLREVTTDKRYTNRAFARSIPAEDTTE